MRFILFIVFCIAFLAGCSSHPPSMLALMESYNKQTATVESDSSNKNAVPRKSFSQSLNFALSISGYGLLNEKKIEDFADEDDFEKMDNEGHFYSSFLVNFNRNHFALGLGLQQAMPYTYVGYVSNYFGAMVWCDAASLILIDDRWFYGGWGMSLSEQFEPMQGLRLGLTQHFSRTLSPYSKPSHSDGMAGGTDPLAAFDAFSDMFHYYEFGAGGYALLSVGKKVSLGLEIRYSRNWTYDANYLTLTLSLLF